MKKRTWIATALPLLAAAAAALSPAGCSRSASTGKAGGDQELGAAIAEASGMLERHDYRAFLERYVAPDERAAVLGGAPIETRAEQFGRVAAAKLLGRLKAVRVSACQLDEKKTTATCPLGGEPDKDPRFTLVDGRWYLRN
jgi:hypothetical protein